MPSEGVAEKLCGSPAAGAALRFASTAPGRVPRVSSARSYFLVPAPLAFEGAGVAVSPLVFEGAGVAVSPLAFGGAGVAAVPLVFPARLAPVVAGPEGPGSGS